MLRLRTISALGEVVVLPQGRVRRPEGVIKVRNSTGRSRQDLRVVKRQ
jgi:hypothetical protein